MLYSDGITEARGRNGEQFGLKRITELVEREHRNPSALVDQLMSAVMAWAPSHEDDLTVLVLHRPASGGVS